MQGIIKSHLKEIEEQEGVRVLYACESGSRAWGFPSADSDYDVRFIYLRPTDWYLTIDEGRDVIEKPINDGLDISGWDLRKALGLFRKSNPPLFEWLGSPIVYMEQFTVAEKLRELAKTHFSPTACSYHYLQMARRNFREYLKGDQVRTKKYFYVLRPLLAMQWLEAELGVVPTDFGVMIERLVTEPVLKQEIAQLTELKRSGAELDSGPRIEAISSFIENEIARWETEEIPHVKRPALTPILNDLFRSSLQEVWK